MSARVDVRAVLDDFANLAKQERNDDGKTECEIAEARAAVAELIEAANGALNWQSGDGRPERQRLRAALARIGGAA